MVIDPVGFADFSAGRLAGNRGALINPRRWQALRKLPKSGLKNLGWQMPEAWGGSVPLLDTLNNHPVPHPPHR